MIAIIDYGAGNLQSVKNALDYLKVDSIITSNAKDIIKAKKVIFPGVGSFGDGIRALYELDLVDPIMKVIEDNKPFLGICLGMEVLFEKSEESPGVEGLGIFGGRVKKFKGSLKIPHIGWNQIKIQKESVILEGIPDNSFFYFVHSYYAEPKDKEIALAKTDYGEEFVSAVEKGNIFALQFHPERSGDIGLRILKNFAGLK